MAASAGGEVRMPVVGMGVYFFRARDPDMLAAWYREQLGIGGGCGTDAAGQSNDWLWFTGGGPMVFQPFGADTEYFPADRTAMMNLRVSGMDDLLARLRAAGIEVTGEQAMPGMGRFARIHDPEGNPVELWEPD